MHYALLLIAATNRKLFDTAITRSRLLDVLLAESLAPGEIQELKAVE